MGSFNPISAAILFLGLILFSALAPAKGQDTPVGASEPASSMVGLEHQDRKDRLLRLAHINGIRPPVFSETTLTPEQHRVPDYPVNIPVLRVVYDDQVFFDFDKAELKPVATTVLNVIAESLRKDVPDVAVLVAGYTDSVGSAQYNLRLGMRRAHAVAALLVSLGIARAQVFTVSFGKEAPIADNNTEQGRALNRRVEFLFAAHLGAIRATLAMTRTPHCEGAAVVGDNCVLIVDRAVVPVELRANPERLTEPVQLSPKAVEFKDTQTVIDLRSTPVPITPR